MTDMGATQTSGGLPANFTKPPPRRPYQSSQVIGVYVSRFVPPRSANRETPVIRRCRWDAKASPVLKAPHHPMLGCLLPHPLLSSTQPALGTEASVRAGHAKSLLDSGAPVDLASHYNVTLLAVSPTAVKLDRPRCRRQPAPPTARLG